MLRNNDLIVFYIVMITLFLLLLYRGFTVKHPGMAPILRRSLSGSSPTGEVVTLLEKKGYSVVNDKLTIPIQIEADEQLLESRLFVDYIAHKNGKLFIVKVGRPRKKLEFTGASLREQLLPYFLLYRPEGVLYVTEDKKDVKLISFTVDEKPMSQRNYKSAIFWFVLGLTIAAWVR